MRVSINPLYRCNFRCAYCYLTEKQLSSRQLLDPSTLGKRLAELPEITEVEVYGGEVTLLPKEYMDALKSHIRTVYAGPIAITTNLSRVPDWLLEEDYEINVSYDFEHRPQYAQVLNNILMLPKPVSLIILATPDVMRGGVKRQADIVRRLNNVRWIEIKPYSSNQANAALNSNADYVRYVMEWIVHYDNNRLINVHNLESVLSRTRNAYSRDHIYITPNGKFGVLEFDLNDREYFKELKNYREFLDWTSHEYQSVMSMKCKDCPYVGRCLTEHYRRTEGELGECSGFKTLIDWWVEGAPDALP